MFDKQTIETMPRYADFGFWFQRQADGFVKVNDRSGDIFLTAVEHEGALIITESNQYDADYIGAIHADWELFKQRPEYFVGKKWTKDKDEPQTFYETVLVGIALIRAQEKGIDPDTVAAKATKSIDWLRGTDFFTCPASTRYHDSYPGGLVQHTLTVMNKTIDLMVAEPFKSTVNVPSAILVALSHDWCKIGLYKPYMRNVKNEETGQWEKVPAYDYIEDRAICLGHGTSSMYLAMKFFGLSMEEAAAIRHHMGRWNAVDAEINELQQANRLYPLVHLVQFADQLAITRY